MSDEKTPAILPGDCKNINLSKLREYFSEKDLEWLPKNCKKNNSGEYQVLVIPYMNRTAVMNRLDDVCSPENWQDDYFPGPGGGILCKLSIRINGEWITKSDGAENTNIESIKGGISDAFKRAATKWGIGRYLANLPKMFGIVRRDGAQYTKYKPKDGPHEWVRFDIPQLPAEWLPAGEKRRETQSDQNQVEEITDSEFITKILNLLEADQKGKKKLEQSYHDKWIPRLNSNNPPAGGWEPFYHELFKFLEK